MGTLGNIGTTALSSLAGGLNLNKQIMGGGQNAMAGLGALGAGMQQPNFLDSLSQQYQAGMPQQSAMQVAQMGQMSEEEQQRILDQLDEEIKKLEEMLRGLYAGEEGM